MQSLRDMANALTNFGRANGFSDTLFRYNPWIRSSVNAFLEQHHHDNQDQLEAVSEQLTERALGWAQQTTYGRAYHDQPIQGWPILEKPLVRARPEDFRGPSLWRIPSNTSGTTGVGLRLERSITSVVAEQVFIDRLLQPWGMNFRDSRVAVLRHEHIKHPGDIAPPYGVYSHGGKRLTFSSKHLSRATAGWYLEELRQFKPDILWVFSAVGDLLAALSLERDEFISIPVVMNASEELTDAALERIRLAFGGDVVNYYGQGERATFSAEVNGQGFFFNPLYGRVELHPVASPPLCSEAGLARAKVIGTGFWNSAQPMVRYDTGDQVLYPVWYGPAELREVELGLRPFTRVAGRPPVAVVTPRGELLLHLDEFHPEIPSIVQMQIVQDTPHHLRLCVVTTPEFSDADRVRMVREARQEIPADMGISVHVVDTLERNPSGKTPFVIRRFQTEFEQRDNQRRAKVPI